MANLIPFRGVLYNPRIVKDIAQVVAPPYDVIDSTGQAALHARHPNNVIRLELGLDQPNDTATHNRYSRAAEQLQAWLTSGALQRDPNPSIYPYSIEYRSPMAEPNAPAKTLRGFLSTIGLEEFGSGHIYPHENTRAAAKADRFELLQACAANFSPIFSLFSDPGDSVMQLIQKSVNQEHPRFDFQDDEGFRQRLWSLDDRRVLDQLREVMATKPLFIADGHHRYETALNYRRLRREQTGKSAAAGLQPYDSVLMLCSSLEDPGLTVLPTHRVLTASIPAMSEIRKLLKDVCDFQDFPFTSAAEGEMRSRFLRTLRSQGGTGHAFGLVIRGEDAYTVVTLRSGQTGTFGRSAREQLDVSLLHNEILSRLHINTSTEGSIVYTKDDHEAIDLVRRGTHPAAWLLNPTKVSEVRAVAAAGDRMPHKSTYFFPKQLTGLVMNVMDK
jgi:uncharacterized protein (DUF1015 family)